MSDVPHGCVAHRLVRCGHNEPRNRLAARARATPGVPRRCQLLTQPTPHPAASARRAAGVRADPSPEDQQGCESALDKQRQAELRRGAEPGSRPRSRSTPQPRCRVRWMFRGNLPTRPRRGLWPRSATSPAPIWDRLANACAEAGDRGTDHELLHAPRRPRESCSPRAGWRSPRRPPGGSPVRNTTPSQKSVPAR